MAENKKSFLLYCDLIHTIEQMPKDLAGELFLHILKYVNDKSPESENLIINLTFEPIKQSLKRDLIKYENICNRNGINGLKGGRPKNPNKPKEPSGLITNPKKPKQPDSDSDSDSEIILLNNNITPLEIALNNFYKFRKELKKPILETSKEALKNKLIKLSNNNNDTAIEIINQSMANGWQGIFELKNNQNGNITNKDSNGKPISKYHN